MAMTKVKSLQMWCKRMADGYRDVEVRDMAASWKSGLVFCAIIHRFRPDLIDYDSLSKENVFENNQLAFEVAERELSIPAFLEAADMVAIRVPDRLSVVTYVSQYYNYFHDKPQLGGPDVSQAQTPPSVKANAAKSDVKTLRPAQVNAGNTPIQKDRQESMGDKCTICGGKVYLLERHIEHGKLFHRSCFRRSDLSPQSKVFKRHPFGSIDEDAKDTVQNKFRKIGTEQETSSKSGPAGNTPDIWQRRAQAKVKDSASQEETVNKTKAHVGKYSGNTNSTTNSHSSDTPAWKKSQDVDMKEKNQTKLSPPVIKKGFPNGDSSVTKDSDRVGKPNNALANKFKALEERTLNKSETSKEKVDDKNCAQNITQNVKSTKTVELDNKHSENNAIDIVNVPVAKPRPVKKQVEKMDTSEQSSSTCHPKPSPRVLKSPEIPHASPRNVTRRANSPVQYKSEFSRPKSPPEKHSTALPPHNFSPKADNAIETKGTNKSAPPLPYSSPPSFPKTQHPKIDISIPKSPHASPRSEPKKTKQDVKVPSIPESVPSKPPRISTNVTSNERSGSPMEATTSPVPVINIAPSKAVIHEPKVGHTALLVTKNKQNDETKNLEIFGGLLKSLAVVRTKHDSDATSGTTSLHHEIGATPKINSGANDVSNQSSQQTVRKFEKVKITTKIETKSKEVSSKKDETASTVLKKPARPKSSFVSGRYGVNEPKNDAGFTQNKDRKLPVTNIDKTKLTTPTSIETTTTTHKVEMRTKEEGDIPAWKQQLDKRKAERQRPKSADILGDGTRNEDKPDWQMEAEKRNAARKGRYIDPEKAKITDNISILRPTPKTEDAGNTNSSSLTDQAPVKPMSPVPKRVPERKAPDVADKYIPAVDTNTAIGDTHVTNPTNVRRRILPPVPQVTEPEKPPSKEPLGDRKKIGVDHKFVFDDVEVNIAPKKPPRPPHPPSPKSSRIPSRPPPPPPKKESPGKKPFLTAYQIQKQLQMIDTKLTQLELKGRTLEDSIRNAEAAEEDNLMIGWFTLVNEKNELVRKEADVIYMSREQELEGEQETIDHQLQMLLKKPAHLMTEAEREEEEYLIEKKLDVVNQRSYIVDSIDEDRLRYAEEDRDIEEMIKKKGFLKDSKDVKVMKKNKKSKQPT